MKNAHVRVKPSPKQQLTVASGPLRLVVAVENDPPHHLNGRRLGLPGERSVGNDHLEGQKSRR
jgi:hypothetical protein